MANRGNSGGGRGRRRGGNSNPGEHAAVEPRVSEAAAQSEARAAVATQAEPQAAVAPVAPPTPEAAPQAFPVVGIGASAGGIAAFEAFFAAMPREDTGMAFVLIQHLAPDHKSVLVDLVRRYTRMKVLEAEDGMKVEPNTTYIIAPNRDLTLVDGRLETAPPPAGSRKPHLTIDHFFYSLAAGQRERAICIVMSGTGSDGTLGVRAVKGEGGLAMAQSPDSTEYDGMPASAIATGLVDYVLPPSAMPAQLIAYVRHAFDPARKSIVTPIRDNVLKKLCLLLRAQTGHDFSQYKETTVERRMERRMSLHQIERPEEYLVFARENPKEVDGLFRDLLIGVTAFFRDAEAFKLLEQKVVPQILAGKSAHDPVRIWVCGCSTGEEAYSIAILLYEQILAMKRPIKVQIFATDIDRLAIEQARTGIYPASIAANVSEERLARYFQHDSQRGTYRIQKHMRDMLIFSEQDVIKDPPFSRLDLISCRNMLIYLTVELQKKLIPLFHYALVPGGALFLGTSETVGEHARLFDVVDRKWKLYTRLPADPGSVRPQLPHFVPPLSEAHERPRILLEPDRGTEANRLRHSTEKALLAHYGPAGVLITPRGDILHIVGRTGKFLEPAAGDATMNVLAMAREGLRRELTIAVHKAVAHKQLVHYPGLSVKANGGFIKANMTVRPVELDGGALAYLVILEEIPEGPKTSEPSLTAEDQSGRIVELERELRAKDEYLQTTLEEMETTNEELKSTNEEMQSINEELQSTNEELETSKEELQSVNEELSTVNAELQDKVSDLSRANNDMNNLLAGTGVGTVFVDNELRIARFTPAATQVINLIATDIGRPIAHIVTNLVKYDNFIADIKSVLDSLVAIEAEVQVKNGSWFLMRIRPYRTIENLIQGAVITLVDISGRKNAEEALRQSEARLNVLINRANAGVCEMDLDGRLLFANDRLCEMLGFTREELLRKRLGEITEAADLPRVQSAFRDLAGGGPDLQLERRYVRRDGAPVRVLERVSAIRDAGGSVGSLLSLAFEPLSAAP